MKSFIILIALISLLSSCDDRRSKAPQLVITDTVGASPIYFDSLVLSSQQYYKLRALRGASQLVFQFHYPEADHAVSPVLNAYAMRPNHKVVDERNPRNDMQTLVALNPSTVPVYGIAKTLGNLQVRFGAIDSMITRTSAGQQFRIVFAPKIDPESGLYYETSIYGKQPFTVVKLNPSPPYSSY
jgi:hypothetical protein